MFISDRKAPSNIIKLIPKILAKLVKSAKVPSERFSFAKPKDNTKISPRSGKKMFSEKYIPPT